MRQTKNRWARYGEWLLYRPACATLIITPLVIGGVILFIYYGLLPVSIGLWAFAVSPFLADEMSQ